MNVIDLNRTDTTYRNEALERWMNSIRPYKVLSVHEEEETVKRYKEGDKDALETLVRGNQRFLLAAARAYSRNAEEILELIQEGNIGLLEAIENYDLTYGVRFISFAVHYVKSHMSGYFKSNSLVRHRISSDIEYRAKKVKGQWFLDNSFEMPEWMLSETMEKEFGRVFKDGGSYFRKASVCFDEDMKNRDFDGDSVIDRTTCVENGAIAGMEAEDMKTISKGLIDAVCKTQIERDVIVNGFGLFGKPELSDLEIGNKHGLEPVQVGYMRRKLINRMRLFAHGKKIKLNKSKFQTYVGQRENSRRRTENCVHKPGTHNSGKNLRKKRRG